MSNDGYRAIDATVAAGVTSTTALDLGVGYQKVLLQIPASSVGNIKLFGSDKIDGTYQQLYASAAAVNIASATSDVILDLKDYTYSRFMKVVASTAPATAVSYQILCNP